MLIEFSRDIGGAVIFCTLWLILVLGPFLLVLKPLGSWIDSKRFNEDKDKRISENLIEIIVLFIVGLFMGWVVFSTWLLFRLKLI